MKLRHVLFSIDKKYKKKAAYADDESEMDEEAVATHEEKTKEKEIEKAEKKFAKENEKLEADDGKAQDESVLKERIEDIEEEFKRLQKERGTGKAELKKERPAEKIEEAIAKLEDKINTAKLQMVDREAGKEVALGTRYVVEVALLRSVLTCCLTVKSIIWTQGMFGDCISIRTFAKLCSRITAAWCKKHDVPVEKLFSKTLLTKCTIRVIVLLYHR